MLEALIAFSTALLITPLMIKLGMRLGITGIDVHKSWKPVLPKTGGFALLSGLFAGFISHLILGGKPVFISIIISSGLAAWLIGLVEDLRGELNPILKPVLLLSSSIPILLSGNYVPRPVIPFVGRTRLYRVYPIIVLMAYPITCNAVNGVDVLNGSMIYTSIPFFAASILIAYLRGDQAILLSSAIALAVLTALIPYNKYPAKIFPGNSGSLLVGSLMASTAILGRMEIAAIIALLPQIMNEMHIIFSIGGIRSAKKVEKRPVKFIDGHLIASRERDAPITIVRLLSADAKVGEKAMVYAMTALNIFTATLAVLTDIFFVEAAMR